MLWLYGGGVSRGVWAGRCPLGRVCQVSFVEGRRATFQLSALRASCLWSHPVKFSGGNGSVIQDVSGRGSSIASLTSIHLVSTGNTLRFPDQPQGPAKPPVQADRGARPSRRATSGRFTGASSTGETAAGVRGNALPPTSLNSNTELRP